MDKEQLKQLAKDSKFISGIYNYCDRWCERCLFTARCLNYAMGEEEDMAEPANYDINNKAFWKKIEESLRLAMELLAEMAKEQGINLNEFDDESIKEDHERQRTKAEEHKLSRSAYEYSEIVNRWFKENHSLLEQREKELNTELELGMDKKGLDEEAASIIDAIEVIRWYQHQIYVKIMRALMKDEDDDEFAEKYDFPKDSDGSAKVALIGMDRSIGAWGRFINHFPEKTEDILMILINLDRLRKSTEKEFPDARSFVRPGFDTLTSPETR